MQEMVSIPSWVRNNAIWWSEDQISDSDFISGIRFLITEKIIKIPKTETTGDGTQKMPEWIKNNAGWWAQGKISDGEFIAGIQFLIINGIMIVDVEQNIDELQMENDEKFRAFERYIKQISKNIADEKRYIEFPNPSGDVIKKFLRDYIKWNFEQEAKNAAARFPDPTYEIIDDAYVVTYNVYINDQPTGLPLDHVSTLKDSFAFWESKELSTEGNDVRIEFVITENKAIANVWVTWVVRDLGDGVLGHAHLGKGIVEVALGDYGRDGQFQLYDVDTVRDIMTHELGHSIGLSHVNDSSSIMYTSLDQNYAYCLLN